MPRRVTAREANDACRAAAEAGARLQQYLRDPDFSHLPAVRCVREECYHDGDLTLLEQAELFSAAVSAVEEFASDRRDVASALREAASLSLKAWRTCDALRHAA